MSMKGLVLYNMTETSVCAEVWLPTNVKAFNPHWAGIKVMVRRSTSASGCALRRIIEVASEHIL